MPPPFSTRLIVSARPTIQPGRRFIARSDL
jgi:hypothetical protein